MWRVRLGVGLLTVSSWASAADEGPPPLTPPVLTPRPGDAAPTPAQSPASPSAAPRRNAPPARSEPSSILVIPGVTTPRTARRPATTTTATTAQPDVLKPAPGGVETSLPPVEIPSLEPPADRAPRRPSASTRGNLNPSDPPTEFRLEPGEPLGPAAPSSVRPLPSSRLDRPRNVPAPPRRPPGLFGRFFPPPPTDRNAASARDRVTVEPRSDPAADAALKRRVERQIRETLGARVASYDVRVVDREVIIRARPARFWQRRTVRNTLESLPGLSGYKATVLIDD